MVIKPKQIVSEVVDSLIHEYPDSDINKVDIDNFWQECWETIVDQLAYYGMKINSKPPEFPPFISKEDGELSEKIKKHLLEKVEERLNKA